MKSFLLYGPEEEQLAEKPMTVYRANQVIFRPIAYPIILID
jgi:hypothetical protein